MEKVECEVCRNIVEIQEVELQIDETCGFKFYMCDECIKEASRREEYDEKIIGMRFSKNKL
jgi:uncharacterized protein YlaI